MPELFDQALAARKGELKNVNIRGLLALKPLAAVEQDREQESFHYNSWHMSSYERKLSDKGLCSYIPMTSVSYTHLDVYKRQGPDRLSARPKSAALAC